jgi:hypothetical protein
MHVRHPSLLLTMSYQHEVDHFASPDKVQELANQIRQHQDAPLSLQQRLDVRHRSIQPQVSLEMLDASLHRSAPDLSSSICTPR